MKRAIGTDPRTRGPAEVRPIEWPNEYLKITDPDWSLKRNVLLGWARCRAHKESFSELCRGWGWKPTRAYSLRDEAAAEIAEGINAAIVRAHGTRE